MFRIDLYSKVISQLNRYDESEFPVVGIDCPSEDQYNRLKEKTMPKKKKKKGKKKKAKAKKKKKR